MGGVLTVADFSKREFPMSQGDFDKISKIAYATTGIVLGEHKMDLVYSRISRRIRQLKVGNFPNYIELIEDHNHQEFTHFVNAITTNLTSFFRENHHFEYLKSEIFAKKNSLSKEPVLIWSAGCSTGEEPYSIAITAAEHFQNKRESVKILATDLDSNVLNHGRDATYDIERIKDVELSVKKKYFLKDKHDDELVKVKPLLQEMIQFNRLNLLGPWPMKKKFDVIFCRNVVIYFNKETQLELFDRYAENLKDGGHLIIGHSENLQGMEKRFKPLGKTIYRKIA